MGRTSASTFLLEASVQSVEELKAKRDFESLGVAPRPISSAPSTGVAHNWLQHIEDPGKVLRTRSKRLQVGGRRYISVYQSGMFRFFINRLTRRVLRRSDREVVGSWCPGIRCSQQPDLITSSPNTNWPLQCRALWRI